MTGEKDRRAVAATVVVAAVAPGGAAPRTPHPGPSRTPASTSVGPVVVDRRTGFGR